MPKIVDHEERRRAIASAAVDVIAERGLEDTKLTDIARQAKVTTGSIAHYFPDKDTVLAAALDEVCTRLFLRIGEPDNPPRIEEIFQTLPINDEKRKEWRVWLAYRGRAPYSPTLSAIHQRYFDEIELAVSEDMEGLHPNPRLAAAGIVAAVDGIGTRATLEPDLWPNSRQKELLSLLITPIIASLASPPDQGR